MTKENLKGILENHLHWLREDCDGWKKMRADLSRANLSGADLSGANLSRANLSGADLSGADLSGANLSRANLSGADLSGADLSGANLSRANLSRANLSGADLSGANLSRANLSGANLSRANLSGADLSGANLSRANLSRANLSRAKIELEILNKFYPIACPEVGSFIGWKKCADNKIVKLEIQPEAKRSSAYSRKCRCSLAKVLEIQDIEGNTLDDEYAVSGYDRSFVYRVGELVGAPDFDEDRRHECSTGIHFFITRQEAVDYIL